MEATRALLAFELLGNTVLQWLVAAALLAVLQLTLVGVKRFIHRRFAASSLIAASAIAAVVETIRPVLMFIIFAGIASLTLALPMGITNWGRGLVVIAVVFQAGMMLTAVMVRVLKFVMRDRAEDPGMTGAFGLVTFFVRFLLWSGLVLMGLENLGFDVTALIAGLGVGGVAVALAVQNILGDLFASLAIILDKPFEVGDFIVVGTTTGTVEYIGIKTTRLRSLSGEQLIIANSDLLGSRISNYKRMQERRVLFRFGVTYGTPVETLRAIPERVKKIFETLDRVRLDRVHLASLAAYSLDFEVVYFVLSPEYNTYMDIHQAVNLRLIEEIEGLGAEFAFPTQELMVNIARSGAEPSDQNSHSGREEGGSPSTPPRPGRTSP